MLTRSQSYANRLSGRDEAHKEALLHWLTVLAENAIGLKLHPGQMVFLISSIGPLHLAYFSVFYLAFNVPGRGVATGLARGGTGPP